MIIFIYVQYLGMGSRESDFARYISTIDMVIWLNLSKSLQVRKVAKVKTKYKINVVELNTGE